MTYAQRENEAQWQHGQRRRQFRSRWLVDRMRDYLPTEHVSLAQHLLTQHAVAEGRKPQDYDRVDNASNGAEGSLIARLDAQRELYGYEAAIRTRLRIPGVRCFWAIAEGDTLADMMRRCLYAPGSDRAARQLVQVTLINAAEYRDFNRAQREGSNSRGLAQCA